MKKYTIEGGIDFFAELYKSFDEEENNHKTEEDNKLCLITKEKLTTNFVEMSCGHKFNYLPLYYDIVNHKKKFNNLEGTSTKLKQNEIRCPYCRKKFEGVLPYYEELGLEKINGVNTIDNSHSESNHCDDHLSNHSKCEFLKPNFNFNPNSDNITEIYEKNLIIENCKFIKCNYLGTKINYYEPDTETYGDDKYYCWLHKKEIIKKYKKDKIEKEKEEVKKNKLKEKEEVKKAKEIVKQKEKDNKKKAKDELKNFVKMEKMNTQENENTILGLSTVDISGNNVIDISGNVVLVCCMEILKSGKNKGMPCCDKIYQNNLCKRHNKINNNVN